MREILSWWCSSCSPISASVRDTNVLTLLKFDLGHVVCSYEERRTARAVPRRERGGDVVSVGFDGIAGRARVVVVYPETDLSLSSANSAGLSGKLETKLFLVPL